METGAETAMSVSQSSEPVDWEKLPDRETIARTLEALGKRGVSTEMVSGRQEALKLVVERIPDEAEVMTGASITLDQIGFTDLLRSGTHRWKNLRSQIIAEKDPTRQRELRKRAAEADYFLGSVQAVAQTGEVVIASASGSQIPAYAFNSDNVIWVVGVQKIVASLDEGLRRVREHALVLETARMKSLGYAGSMIGKVLIFERERVPGRKISMILANERLGF